MSAITAMVVIGAWVGPATAAMANAAAGAACEAHLSAAQQAKFRMAREVCSDSAPGLRSAPAAWHADALVASAGLPPGLPSLPELPALESAHLQLFERPGVVMARMDADGRVPARPSGPVATATPALRRAADRNGAPGHKAQQRAVALAPEIDEVARRHNIDPLLLHAMAYVESRHNPAATSHAGARGLLQVMPATGRRFGVGQPEALHQPATNLEVGATYLKTLQQRFGGNLTLVLAAYNAGEGAVERHGRRVPRYAETQDYVRQVLARYQSLTALARAVLPATAPRAD